MTATTSPASAAETSRLRPPSMVDVLSARQIINRYLPPTPAIRPPALADALGCDVVLKLENLQPIGAFKVRGGLYFMSRLSEEERAHGVVTASTGNHAQSIAYAAREFGVRAIIYMPENPNPTKLAATKRLGAEVIEYGADFDACRVAAEAHAARTGMRHIHAANEPDLIAGVGTYALELIEAAPELDVVIVPVGGGSGACGVATVFKTMKPETRVIAVQAANMPAVYRSFHEHRLLALEGGSTWAEGLATRVAFELPFRIMQELVDDVVLVNEDDMRRAALLLLDKAHIVAEGAGAAATAAARNLANDLRGKHVGLIVSGGNITLETLRSVLSAEC